MKIGGRAIDCGPKTIEIFIPRGEFGDIQFKFIGVIDDDEFDKLYPIPEPPRSMKVGVGTVMNVEDPTYKAQLANRGAARQDWFFLKSIAPSNIEWDTVKLEDFSTWGNWREDLKKAGFSVSEISTLYNAFAEANVITDSMIKEARQRFLAFQQGVQSGEQPSPIIGQ
jgi:hypothetical protein